MSTLKAVVLITGDTNIRGSLYFVQEPNGPTHVNGRIGGLSPGLHGFHIHALGDTTNGCNSTGPHFNPLKKDHGAPTDKERHAGDLGNILAGPDGVAEVSVKDWQVGMNSASLPAMQEHELDAVLLDFSQLFRAMLHMISLSVCVCMCVCVCVSGSVCDGGLGVGVGIISMALHSVVFIMNPDFAKHYHAPKRQSRS